MPKSELSKQDSNLDVLRSIAVLAVLGSHLAQLHYVKENPGWHKWGHFGVLIFFVHTSLVLMMSMERLAARHSRIAWPFYIQRAFRIYPLSILCVLVVVICHVPEGPYSMHYVRPDAFKLVSNLLLIQNTGTGSVSDPLWSLPYEVQMYAALPLLYWLIKRHTQRWVMAALIALSAGLGSLQLLAHVGKADLLAGVTAHQHFGALQLLAVVGKGAQYVPCFMGGILAFWLRRKQEAVLPAVLWPVWVIGLGFLYQSVSFFGDSFAACLILGASAGWFRDLKPGFGAALAHQIAKYSYGIYLAHLPLILLCFRELTLGSQAVRWVLFLLLLPAVVVALYHCVESPLIQLGRRLTAPPKERPLPTGTESVATADPR